jgi:hypothetical protein
MPRGLPTSNAMLGHCIPPSTPPEPSPSPPPLDDSNYDGLFGDYFDEVHEEEVMWADLEQPVDEDQAMLASFEMVRQQRNTDHALEEVNEAFLASIIKISPACAG